MTMINTFVFFDLEATGLAGIGDKPRITELAMVAVHRLMMVDTQCSPSKTTRITDKLTICVYPMKPISAGAAAITGINIKEYKRIL